MADRMSILSPTGHLGFTPIERGSFELGVARRPDAIVADSGSCDIGPQPLGADEPRLKAYLDRLVRRPSYAKVLAAAAPYFPMFPLDPKPKLPTD